MNYADGAGATVCKATALGLSHAAAIRANEVQAPQMSCNRYLALDDKLSAEEIQACYIENFAQYTHHIDTENEGDDYAADIYR